MVIVMEYCEEGDLTHFLEKREQANDFLTEEHILNLLLQMSLALEYIHNRKILHRDIKTSNFFMHKNQLKLGDFGLSKLLDSTD